uniref:Uncharacterized protein n=1 Tax=Bionectria ochroleuca TaxID=29856 RepID=A0A8H7NCI6_BIOOC
MLSKNQKLPHDDTTTPFMYLTPNLSYIDHPRSCLPGFPDPIRQIESEFTHVTDLERFLMQECSFYGVICYGRNPTKEHQRQCAWSACGNSKQMAVSSRAGAPSANPAAKTSLSASMKVSKIADAIEKLGKKQRVCLLRDKVRFRGDVLKLRSGSWN